MLKMIIKTFFFFLTPLDTYLQWCRNSNIQPFSYQPTTPFCTRVWESVPVMVTVSADRPCWLRLLVSESMWSVVRLESSCSSAVCPAPPKLSWSTEARAHVSGGKLKSAHKYMHIYPTSLQACLFQLKLNSSDPLTFKLVVILKSIEGIWLAVGAYEVTSTGAGWGGPLRGHTGVVCRARGVLAVQELW